MKHTQPCEYDPWAIFDQYLKDTADGNPPRPRIYNGFGYNEEEWECFSLGWESGIKAALRICLISNVDPEIMQQFRDLGINTEIR